jgi:hypothetical protein
VVERKTGTDRRPVALRLTDAGKRQVKSPLVGRQHALSWRFRGLDDWERSAPAALPQGAAWPEHSEANATLLPVCDDAACPDETCPMMTE